MLDNYIYGHWVAGTGDGEALRNPTTREELARVSTAGIDLDLALRHTRDVGGPALRALTFAQRAGLLDAIAKLFIAQRAKYVDIARNNSGNTARDAAFDIDGAIGTIRYYAKLGAGLGDARYARDEAPFALGKDPSLQAIHLGVPRVGAAIHINAFNFPAWGTWEKAAVSILAGVAVFTKPASATALLSWQMVRDVVEAGALPAGALSILCGSAGDLLDHVDATDVIAFTGSATTAERVRGHRAVIRHGVRVNCEADSLNAILLGSDVGRDSAEFALFVQEVVREMTLKAGQKCTAIRRIIVPRAMERVAAEALSGALGAIVTGDPARDGVEMGPLVSEEQKAAFRDATSRLRGEASILFERTLADIQADEPERGAFVMPILLRANDSRNARSVHSVEAFGPAATLLSYETSEEAWDLIARGRGSLVSSVVTADEQFAHDTALAIAGMNGRVLLLDERVRAANPGHGTVMPSCIHGGPGRAGGGEELGGLRGLWFYMQRVAIQGNAASIHRLANVASVPF